MVTAVGAKLSQIKLQRAKLNQPTTFDNSSGGPDTDKTSTTNLYSKQTHLLAIMSPNNKTKNKRRWLIYIAAAIILSAGLAVVFDFFPEQEKELRNKFRDTVENTFPQQAVKIAQSFGLTYYGEEAEESPKINSAVSSVVLIHGLDEPGKVWMNLAPALTSSNINVWQMRYPNDQPIVDSTWFFYEELKRLKQLGINRITIVAHSMGGLVSRELLTNTQVAYIEKVFHGDVPRVLGLVMVGTPNHGSEMARFRMFGEIREQWVNMVKGQGHILRGILDGAGEAKIDLLPESQFLKVLNNRPHPEGVKMLIIAGVVSPWNGKNVDRLLNSARKNAPAAEQKMLVKLGAFFNSMSDGLGDGLVTVESTRLDGIEHRTVRGTHLSMIRNISKESSRIPPAVPLIIEYLGQVYSKKQG